MKALIVEDDYTSRKILTSFVSQKFETDTAVDGHDGLMSFKKELDKGECYDVIFLDIIMPKKDGLQLLKEIRKYEEEHSILGRNGVKIIMTTALGDSKNVLSAFKSGCEGYIVKPYNRSQIYDKLDELGVNIPVG